MEEPITIQEEEVKKGYYDHYIINQMNELKEAVSDDWDGILYVCGRERTGKTTFAQQLAVLLDPSWSINRMCWTGSQFKDLVLKANQYECIVLDEAYLTFAKAQRMVQLNNEIIGMLTMIGKKNLFIIIVAPLFWQMNEYLMVHRTCAMYRVYSKGKRRGLWQMWGYESKERLYYRGKDYKSFNVVPSDRHGRFGRWTVVNKELYDERKDAAIKELEERNKKPSVIPEAKAQKLAREGAIRFAVHAYINGVIPWGKKKAAASLLGISERTFDERKGMLSLSTNKVTEVTEEGIFNITEE